MSATTGRSHLRLMGGAVLGLVLVVGGLSGAAITRAITPKADEARQRDECERFRPNERRSRGPFDDLGLSAEQERGMDAVLEKRKNQLDEFWKVNKPRMDSIVNGARAELLEILTPEQRAEHNQRTERWRAERRALEERCAQKQTQGGEGSNGDRRPPQRRENRSEHAPPLVREARA